MERAWPAAACFARVFCCLLGGSWVVISGVISRVTFVITQIRGLLTPLITTHEPPSVRAVWIIWGLGVVIREADGVPCLSMVC